MPRVVAFTSFNHAYLPQVMVLAETLKAAHPEWELHALLVDDPAAEPSIAAALARFDRIVYAHELDIPNFRAWLFQHDVVEACTAVKATMLRRLLEQGANRVFYFDPDIAVFHSLDHLLGRLDTASVILTPHQVEPNDEEWAVRDNELEAMRYGIYNLGFIAVARDAIGFAFARWWEGRLLTGCFDDVRNGIFTDQKYCDMVPALFEGVHVERDPGCNVASWNLSRRRIEIAADGRILANGSPLKFYHFTKARSVGGVMTEKNARGNLEVFEIWRWYMAELQEHESRLTLPAWPYGHFSNAAAIPRRARELYRRRPDLAAVFTDPFAAAGASYYRWLQQEEPAMLGDVI